MMMSKPAPESKEETAAPPAFATAPVAQKQTPQSAVEDLERRLALLGNAEEKPAAAPPPPAISTVPAPVAAAPAAAPAAAVKGGKNALLVRLLLGDLLYQNPRVDATS